MGGVVVGLGCVHSRGSETVGTRAKRGREGGREGERERMMKMKKGRGRLLQKLGAEGGVGVGGVEVKGRACHDSFTSKSHRAGRIAPSPPLGRGGRG